MDKYKDLKYTSRSRDLNDLSYWFPKIKDCGIKVPKTIIIPFPEDMVNGETFYMENIPEDEKRIERFVRETVLPEIEKAGFRSRLFLKNGACSNKFDAGKSCFCLPDVYEITRAIANIQYFSLCNETGGEFELVIRERVGDRDCLIPKIYNGLPLRPEFRVFYDFDSHEPIFAVDYWDCDYVYPHLYDATDRIVFAAMKEYLKESFETCKDDVIEMVDSAMKNVARLQGPWSIDLMMSGYPEEVQYKMISEFQPKYCTEPEPPELYLIDMALAEQSAYWELRPGIEE